MDIVVRELYTQVFAYGEDALTLRLKCEHFDLRVGYVNWRAFAHPVQIKEWRLQKKKEERYPNGYRSSFGGVTQI